MNPISLYRSLENRKLPCDLSMADLQGLVDASGQIAGMLRLADHCRGWFPLPFTQLLRGEGHLC